MVTVTIIMKKRRRGITKRGIKVGYSYQHFYCSNKYSYYSINLKKNKKNLIMISKITTMVVMTTMIVLFAGYAHSQAVGEACGGESNTCDADLMCNSNSKCGECDSKFARGVCV